MGLEIEGYLYKKMDKQQVSEKFAKREFVVKTIEQYEQLVKMEFVNDKCAELDNYKEGEKVKVQFNLQGREWKKDGNSEPQYFTTIKAWRIEKSEGETKSESQPEATPQNNATPQSNTKAEPQTKEAAKDDDLPF